MTKMMTQETPVKVLSLLGIAMLSMFFMTAVSLSNVTWSGNSGSSLADPFSPKNVVAFIDQTAWVYSDAANTFLINPAKQDFAFVPENLAWISDNAQLMIAVAVGLEEPLPQLANNVSVDPMGQVAGATIYSTQYIDNSYQSYNDNIFSLLLGQ